MTDINDYDWLENSEEPEPPAKDSEQPLKLISETPQSELANRKTTEKNGKLKVRLRSSE